MFSPAQIPVSLEMLRSRKLSSESAWILAMASKLAGDSAETASDLLSKWGFESGEFFVKSRTRGFLAAQGDLVLLAFSLDDEQVRGQEALVVERPHGEVTALAYTAFAEVDGIIRSALGILGAKDKNIWVTGHGLGGAVAIIAAAELDAEFPVAALHTYNPSCAGKFPFADWFDATFLGRSYRFEAAGDRIFSVPPGFRQVQQLVRLDFGETDEENADAPVVPPKPLDLYIAKLQEQVETERLKRREPPSDSRAAERKEAEPD